MTFLNPFLLLGLTAAAIPLIIHLFNFRRPRRVEFSSLAFLHELQKSTMQRVRIKQWLLLALRTLAIVFLVLAFARPTITGDFTGKLGGRGRTSTAIVLDNSRSMMLRDGAGSYMEQARTIAATLVGAMESGDETYVIPTISTATRPVAFQNAASATQSLLSVEAVDGEMSLSGSVARAVEILETSSNPNREVYVLSDLQESTFADSIEVGVPESPPVFLLPVGTRTHENVSISDVEIISRILSVGQVVRMEATLVNHGDRPVDDIVLSLYLDGERVSRATTSIGAREVITVPIAVTPRTSGWLGGQMEIEDEDFQYDDVRRFTLFIPEERSILVARGQQTNTRYVELALSGDVTGSRIKFTVDLIEETGLARAVLGTYDTVVLAGVEDLSSGEQAALVSYVKEGGGLLIFPGEDLVVEDYNALFSELGGGRLEGVTGQAGGGVTMAGFGLVDVEHALFEGMFDLDEQGGTPRLEQPDIFRMMAYRPGSGSEQALIRLTDDKSFLQEIRHERGSVIFYAIAPDDTWSDFPVRGLFVPLLYRSIYYLSAGGSVMGEKFLAGAAAQIRLSGVSSDATITIDSEDGDSYLPELRRTPGGVLALIGSDFLETGTYDVKSGDETLRKIVVHPGARESEVKTLEPEKGRQMLSDATGLSVNLVGIAGTDSDEIKAQLSSVRTGVEVWNVFMLLALFTLSAEMIVEKKWRPEAA